MLLLFHGLEPSKEYPVHADIPQVHADIPQGFILGRTLFLLYINDILDNVICDIAIYADYATLL